MQFLTSLFGDSGGTAITAVLALGIVLVLIVLLVWALKFVFKASTSVGRGRNRRLTVVDALALDTKRQLFIVRRDNVEHLILTGGPQDVVLETGIAIDSPALLRQPVAVAMPEKRPVAEETKPASPRLPGSAVERLREYARPLGQRLSPSLRHTGLMRPVSRMEVIPGYLNDPARDSAKTTPLVEAKGGDGLFKRDGFTAGK